MENSIAVRDAFYVVFGLVSLLGVIYSIRSSQGKADGDNRERIVRIDENTKELRNDVADIKADMRQTRESIAAHERRIIKLEGTQDMQRTRIDELKADVARLMHAVGDEG